MRCVNCSAEHTHAFCPYCGEKADTPKITFRSIFNDGLATITNMDKGFLSNVKHLALRPQTLVMDYLNGKRKGIFNPISFLIISITIFLVVDSLVKVDIEVSGMQSEVYNAGYEAGRFIKLYFKYFWIVAVIWLSFATKIFFGKYNLAEHLAINSFIIGQATLVGLLGFVFSKTMGILFNPLVYLSIIWLTYQVFKEKDKDTNTLFLSIGSTVIFFVQLVLLVASIGVIRTY
jgi:hypothetical protein